MDSNLWKVGDLVSRHGPDKQRIVTLYPKGGYEWGTLRVVVTKSCGSSCCPLDGEWEDNLMRRYEWVVHGELKSQSMPKLLGRGK